MSWTDKQIDDACDTLKRMIHAADNSNHAGESAVIKAVAASDLDRALQAILPYCTEAPKDIKALADSALAKARGVCVVQIKQVA